MLYLWPSVIHLCFLLLIIEFDGYSSTYHFEGIFVYFNKILVLTFVEYLYLCTMSLVVIPFDSGITKIIKITRNRM